MGFWASFKRIFSLSGEDEVELERLRAKHGIDAAPKEEILKEIKNVPGTKDYDVWEDLATYRSTFFFGSWATRKFKFRPVGEEKVKRELERLEKKREEQRRKSEEGGTSS